MSTAVSSLAWFKFGSIELPIEYAGDPFLGQLLQQWLVVNKDARLNLTDVTSLSQDDGIPLVLLFPFCVLFVVLLESGSVYRA